MGTTPLPRARTVASLVLAGLLGLVGPAACDSDAGGPGDAGSSATEESPPDGPVEHRLLEVVSTTLGGGSVDEHAVDLTAPGGVDELVGGLESGMPGEVRRVVRRLQARPAVQGDLADGARLYGAVAWIGCETPREIAVVRRHGDLEVKPILPGKGTVECFAPVTSVVVFTA